MANAIVAGGVEFREVPGCPGYFAGSDGSLMTDWTKGMHAVRCDSWRPVPKRPNSKHGHLLVCMRTEHGWRVTAFLHQVILTTFVGPCPAGMVGCHYPDPNPANCAITNLRWDTQAANTRDMKEHGRHKAGSAAPQAKLTDEDVRRIFLRRAEGATHQAIADEIGVRRALVTRVLLRKRYANVVVNATEDNSAVIQKKHARGVGHPWAKFREDDIRKIRQMHRDGMIYKNIAKLFGVSSGAIGDIVCRRTWNHVV